MEYTLCRGKFTNIKTGEVRSEYVICGPMQGRVYVTRMATKAFPECCNKNWHFDVERIVNERG